MIEDRDYMRQPEYHEPHRMRTDVPVAAAGQKVH
jgi:hypothetical protein